MTVAAPFAYVADEAAGLVVIDVSDPVNPAIIGAVDTPGRAYDVDVHGQYAYVADSGTFESGLQVIDVSIPQSPHIVGSFPTPNSAHAVEVNGSYAYVADNYTGIYVIGVWNPSNPLSVGSADTPGYAIDVAVSGELACIADYMHGFHIYAAQCEVSGVSVHEARTPSGIICVSPNPTNRDTSLEFFLHTAGPARLRVFDATGRLVCSPLSKFLPHGLHKAAWDGCDSFGRPLSPGCYWLVLSSKDGCHTVPVVRID